MIIGTDRGQMLIESAQHSCGLAGKGVRPAVLDSSVPSDFQGHPGSNVSHIYCNIFHCIVCRGNGVTACRTTCSSLLVKINRALSGKYSLLVVWYDITCNSE